MLHTISAYTIYKVILANNGRKRTSEERTEIERKLSVIQHDTRQQNTYKESTIKANPQKRQSKTICVGGRLA
jgi:hypothetical protein